MAQQNHQYVLISRIFIRKQVPSEALVLVRGSLECTFPHFGFYSYLAVIRRDMFIIDQGAVGDNNTSKGG